MPRAPHRHRQRGFSAVLMIIMIVMLGGVISYAVSMTSSMHASLAQEIAAARAQQAARGGLEWARYRIGIPAVPVCNPSTNLALPLSTGNMPVTVTCALDPVSYTEGAATVRIYQITAIACFPAAGGSCPNLAGGADYVEARVTGLAQR